MKISWYFLFYSFLCVFTYFIYSDIKDVNIDNINTPCTILNGYESYDGSKDREKKFALIVLTPGNKTIELKNVKPITYFKALKQKKMNFMLSPIQLEIIPKEIKRKLFLSYSLNFIFFVITFMTIIYILNLKYDFL